MNFIILGDKYQKGMKSKGCVGLIKINKTQNIFENQYKIIKSFYPLANIIYIHGFESKKFTNFLSKNRYDDIKHYFNNDYEINNQTFSLSLAQQFLNDDCFIMFGDNILSKSIFNKFNNKCGPQVFISQDSSNEIGCIINNNIIENISFDLDNSLSNMYYINKDTAHLLSSLVSDKRYHNNFIFEIINKTIDIGICFKPYYLNKKAILSRK
jgi:CTP:phosphocholine cytidylyltransferase-like protein